MDKEEIRKEIEPEGLRSLDDARLGLRDLHFRETRGDSEARERLYHHNVDGLIERHRALWTNVRAERESRRIAEDRESMRPADHRGRTPTFTPRDRQVEEERQRSLQSWAVHRFQEQVPHDELRRIREIALTIEQWVTILERAESSTMGKASS